MTCFEVYLFGGSPFGHLSLDVLQVVLPLSLAQGTTQLAKHVEPG